MPNINSLLDDHVVLRYECLDRILLTGYVPRLHQPEPLIWFLSQHRGEALPRYEVLGAITRAFLRAVETFAAKRHIPVVHFERGQRKEAIAAPYFQQARREGVVLIGIGQEWARVIRPGPKAERQPGRSTVTRGSAFVNHIYFYIWDTDFGPSFIKFCTFAPWTIKVWLNGHQWMRRQLERKGVAYEPLDNGLAAVADGCDLQRLGDRLSAPHLQRFVDRWLYRLPGPLTQRDQHAGYTYQLSIAQLEVSRTEVFDRPLHGRQFFEEVIREQLDLGRPEKLQLLFHRKIRRHAAGAPFRTRVLCAGVDPSLQVSYRHTKVKQYWKGDRALRTETTFNDPYELGVGRRLPNLPLLTQLGRAINGRLLELERQSHRPTEAVTTFESLVLPSGLVGARAPGLRFGDPRVVALFGALSHLCWVSTGFRSKDLRPLIEHHLARPYGMHQMAYDLRRLRRKQLIARIPKTFRYYLTTLGRQLIIFCTKLYSRALCRGLGQLEPAYPTSRLNQVWRQFEKGIDALLKDARLAV